MLCQVLVVAIPYRSPTQGSPGLGSKPHPDTSPGPLMVGMDLQQVETGRSSQVHAAEDARPLTCAEYKGRKQKKIQETSRGQGEQHTSTSSGQSQGSVYGRSDTEHR